MSSRYATTIDCARSERPDFASMPGMWVFVLVRRALDRTLRVPVDATSREVRTDGAIAALAGFAIVLVSGLAPLAVSAAGLPLILGRAALVVVLVGYGLFVIGGYRALTGKNPASESYEYASSLRRIFTGVGLVVAATALFLGLMVLVLYMLGVK